jgi:hypothetical protein
MLTYIIQTTSCPHPTAYITARPRHKSSLAPVIQGSSHSPQRASRHPQARPQDPHHNDLVYVLLSSHEIHLRSFSRPRRSSLAPHSWWKIKPRRRTPCALANAVPRGSCWRCRCCATGVGCGAPIEGRVLRRRPSGRRWFGQVGGFSAHGGSRNRHHS